MKTLFLFLIISFNSFGSEQHNYCKNNELPRFNDEMIRRVENVFSVGNLVYSFNKKEIEFYLSNLCKDDPLLLVEFKNFMENMGYGIKFSSNEIFICYGECLNNDNSYSKREMTFFIIALFFLCSFLIFIILKKK